jgi:hypothetical protein
MNYSEDLFNGIIKPDLSGDSIYGIFIKFYCNLCQKPILMTISHEDKERLDRAYFNEYDDEELKVDIMDFDTKVVVSLNMKDVSVYLTKRFENGNMDDKAYFREIVEVFSEGDN